jgi:hypothetical protein
MNIQLDFMPIKSEVIYPHSSLVRRYSTYSSFWDPQGRSQDHSHALKRPRLHPTSGRPWFAAVPASRLPLG